MCMGDRVPMSMLVEVRRQLWELIFLCHIVSSGDQTQVVGFGDRHPNLLSHPASPAMALNPGFSDSFCECVFVMCKYVCTCARGGHRRSTLGVLLPGSPP